MFFTASSFGLLYVRECIINRWATAERLRSNALIPHYLLGSFPELVVSNSIRIINFILAEFVVGNVLDQKNAEETKLPQNQR